MPDVERQARKDRTGWLALVLACFVVAVPVAQQSNDAGRARTLDSLLDLYVRNGEVYYRAIKSERARLDSYVAQLATASVEKESRDEQLAFWLNAYDALVLRTIADHYPILGKSAEYPAKSIRQIPGAFERLTHRVAGRTVTLDQIEQTILSGFHDPRVYFAIGRGAVGSGRLRSEAFSAARLDSYVNQLATASVDALAREEQLAFWLNAYNALVLRTVADHYPIQGRSTEYPAKSIRQISGAFERLPHRVAGRTLTLDQIEQTVLPGFHDPRVYFALGRGAVGSGRLRSEAFTPARLAEQLADVAGECVTRAQCVTIDRENGQVGVSSIFSWREKEFAAVYADKAPAPFSARSPIERAVIAFVLPTLLATEKEFIVKNTFQVTYTPFDWTLNDLTGRGGR